MNASLAEHYFDEAVHNLAGVIAVLKEESGRVVASASDFDQEKPGGFDLMETQKMRARQTLYHVAIQAFCAPAVVKVMDERVKRQLVTKMIEHEGFDLVLIPVNHENQAVNHG